ncbi:unnamed protein product [[Actinomadura] parvosata subsp. kistnae]|nr:unnamed protein product [Actinomadura parvosata subsp. kistnae]
MQAQQSQGGDVVGDRPCSVHRCIECIVSVGGDVEEIYAATTEEQCVELPF